MLKVWGSSYLPTSIFINLWWWRIVKVSSSEMDSRGLAGGAFFMATLLNRKEAKTARGKDDIDSLKDFILLKGDVRFCQYFICSKNLDPEVDNTPDDIKAAGADQKVAYLHKHVEALRELLPFFRNCKFEDLQLGNFSMSKAC